MVKRLSKRRTCVSCGRISISKKGINSCSFCDGKLEQRNDDKPEVIKKRLSLFHQLTEPVLDFYRSKKLLIEINGQRTINQVYKDIFTDLRKVK